MRLKLQGLECDIRYKQGKDNVVADFLSRLSPENNEIEDTKIVTAVTRQQKRHQQQEQQQQKQHSNESNENESIMDMDGLENINFSIDELHEDKEGLTYKDFEEALANDQINFKLLKFTKEKIEGNKMDATFVILNSKSAYKELSELICRIRF